MASLTTATAARARTKRWARALTFRLLRLSIVPLLIRETIQRGRVTLVLYHDPDPDTFERHLALLRRLYSIVDLRTCVDALRAGSIARLPPKPLVITFDDGHRGNHALLPILERAGLPVTIFLCGGIVGTRRRFWFLHVDNPESLKRLPDSERLERLHAAGFDELALDPEALSEQDVRTMAGPLVDFQSHGLTHPILPACDDEKARAEVRDSRALLSSHYGLDVFAFSYPNGDYSERELRLVREAGYLCGVTVDPGFNAAGGDMHRLKRIGLDDHDGLDALVVKCSGLWGLARRLLQPSRARGTV